MKYRAVANGNIVDDVHPSLVGWLYLPVSDEPEPAPAAPASRARQSAPAEPAAEVEVEFTPAEKLDVEPEKPKRRAPKRRRKAKGD